MSYIGVDLGSTNSCAAVSIGTTTRMIELNASGAVTMPSVVCIVNETALVGVDAVEAGKLNPDVDFRNFKRKLAEKWHDDEDTGYQTCEGLDETGAPNGMLAYRGPVGLEGKYATYSPTDLSYYILHDIIGAANDFLAPHDTVTGLCIGVPATFTPDQIAEVKRAAAMAGISAAAVHTIEEPVAAAIANNIDAKKSRCSIVVDFGGGTLDVTILRSGEGLIRVKAKNGIGDLGGADFDRRIADYVINLFRTENRSASGEDDVTLKDNVMTKILVEAEQVKKRLTDVEETIFRLETVSRSKDHKSLHMIYPINRRTLNELTRDLQERVLSAVKAAIEDAKRQDPKFTIRDIQDVLLVGGMTRMPAIRQLVSEFFGKQPRKDENPEQVVAMGCAIKAAILEGRRPDVSIQDVMSFDVGVETVGEVPAVLIKRGTPFPFKEPMNFDIGTTDESQTEMSVRLLYITRSRAPDCHVLESVDVPVEPAPVGRRGVLSVTVDAEGHPSIVDVAA